MRAAHDRQAPLDHFLEEMAGGSSPERACAVAVGALGAATANWAGTHMAAVLGFRYARHVGLVEAVLSSFPPAAFTGMGATHEAGASVADLRQGHLVGIDFPALARQLIAGATVVDCLTAHTSRPRA